MTPAILLLEKHNINFSVLSYEHEQSNNHYGLEAVEKLNLPPEQVFKTLVLETNTSHLIVAITPVAQQVNLKKLAKLANVKKVSLAPAQKVQASTGYILGGVSPLGQKKSLTTYIHISASNYECIYISAGKRGLEVKLSVADLTSMTDAKLGDF